MPIWRDQIDGIRTVRENEKLDDLKTMMASSSEEINAIILYEQIEEAKENIVKKDP